MFLHKRSLVLVLALVFVADSFAVAQSKPNFAGKWTLVMDANVQPGGPYGELGRNPVVTQDAKTLTVVTMQPAGELRSVYNLDGSESKNPITFGDVTVERLSTVKWDGAKLIISTKMNLKGIITDSTQTWSLNSTGELVVDAVTNALGKQITSKRTYKKS
jgi:hypothetical protein